MAKRRRRGEDGEAEEVNTTVEEVDSEQSDPVVSVPKYTPPPEEKRPEMEAPAVSEAPTPSGPVPAKVPLRVFAQVCGLKWDQMAGFVHHAKKENLGPLSVLEWREALHKFQTRPVR